MTTATTARQQRADLETSGLQGQIVDDLVRETAPGRHEWRVRETLAVALQAAGYVAADCGDGAEGVRRRTAVDAATLCRGVAATAMAAARERTLCDFSGPGGAAAALAEALGLLVADAVGVGGHWGGTSGAGTDRLPCLRTLGSGRKQAGDGAAYMAALMVVLEHFQYGHLRWQAVDGDLVVSLFESGRELGCSRLELPRRWRYSLLRAILRAHAGLYPRLSPWLQLVDPGALPGLCNAYDVAKEGR